jgi:hypothetical protein
MRTEATLIPSGDDLRDAIIARAQRFCELTNTTKTELGRKAVGDGAFISDLESGRNITFKLYDKLREYLDANWPKQAEADSRRVQA